MKTVNRKHALLGAGTLLLAACSGENGIIQPLQKARIATFKAAPDGATIVDDKDRVLVHLALRDDTWNVTQTGLASVLFNYYTPGMKPPARQEIGHGYGINVRSDGSDVNGPNGFVGRLRAQADESVIVTAPSLGWQAARVRFPNQPHFKPLMSCREWKADWNWAFGALLLASAAAAADGGLNPIADVAYVYAVANMVAINKARPGGC